MQSLSQPTLSSSSLRALLAAPPLAHCSWMESGTLIRPEGFRSQSRRNLFSLAPSVCGGGLSAPFFAPPPTEQEGLGLGFSGSGDGSASTLVVLSRRRRLSLSCKRIFHACGLMVENLKARNCICFDCACMSMIQPTGIMIFVG